MWALLSKRLWLWIFFAVGIPVISRLAGAVGDRLEARNGPTTTSRALKTTRNWLARRATGPLAPNRHPTPTPR